MQRNRNGKFSKAVFKLQYWVRHQSLQHQKHPFLSKKEPAFTAQIKSILFN
jgi:hypothetical protein